VRNPGDAVRALVARRVLAEPTDLGGVETPRDVLDDMTAVRRREELVDDADDRIA
jgi:hypothetical protein